MDFLRRCYRDTGISPLLADDCGLGKTVQALGSLYADYLDAKENNLKGPFEPSLVVALNILTRNWIKDNEELLGGALVTYLWAGRTEDQGEILSKGIKTLDHTTPELVKWIGTLNPTSPETLRTVIITSYGTGWQRALSINGVPARQSKKYLSALR